MFNPFKRKSKKVEAAAKEHEKPVVAGSAESPKKDAVKAGRSYPLGVLVAPRLTEKSTWLNSQGKYVFEVQDKASANFVREAVSKKYGVGVTKVNILTQPGKEVRIGRKSGWRKGFKKAIVTLEKGQNIEFT